MLALAYRNKLIKFGILNFETNYLIFYCKRRYIVHEIPGTEAIPHHR